MPRPVYVAAGTGDVQAFTGAGSLYGWSVRESAGTPALATAVLRDGTSTSDLTASQSLPATFPAVTFSTGLFVDRTAGNCELVLYIA